LLIERNPDRSRPGQCPRRPLLPQGGRHLRRGAADRTGTSGADAPPRRVQDCRRSRGEWCHLIGKPAGLSSFIAHLETHAGRNTGCHLGAWLHRRERRFHHRYCVDSNETKAEDASGAGRELRPIMNNIPELAHNSEMIAVMRQALHVGWAKLSLTILLTAAFLGLSATIAIEPQSSGIVAAGFARSLVGGVILGSNAWPSVPVDVQARLLLWSPDCSEEGRCRWVSAAPIDE
jgi:hypothetical protein